MEKENKYERKKKKRNKINLKILIRSFKKLLKLMIFVIIIRHEENHD